MPFFICPNCKNRSIDNDGRQGLLRQAVSCERCGFGLVFEILDDYYPPPNQDPQHGRVRSSGGDWKMCVGPDLLVHINDGETKFIGYGKGINRWFRNSPECRTPAADSPVGGQ